jgi:hypothetical protein
LYHWCFRFLFILKKQPRAVVIFQKLDEVIFKKNVIEVVGFSFLIKIFKKQSSFYFISKKFKIKTKNGNIN